MKALQKITSVFLAFAFLFSSLGFTISSMVCVKSGKGKVSLSYIENCCVKPKTLTVVNTACCDDDDAASQTLPENNFILKKADCCDISNFNLKLNDFQNAQKLSPEQPVILHSLFNIAEAFQASKTEHTLAYQYSDLPPPLSGRALLNFISTLTI
jgi:hypothetical protein